MLKQLNATENTLKARTMIIKRELTCQGMKQKLENINEVKYKQMRWSRQKDKLEQWVMNWAVKNEVLGSILRSDKQKIIFLLLIVSVMQIKHSYLYYY